MSFDEATPTPAPEAPDYTPPLPAAVRRAAARADELVQQFAEERRPPPDPPPAEPPPAVTQGEHPVTDPAPLAPPPAPPPPSEDWEQKYRTLQGKYDTELPGLRSQVEAMQRLIASLQAPAPTPAPAAPAAAAPVAVPPKDVEDFGDDLIAASRRWAAAELMPTIESLRREVAEMRSGLGTRVQQVETRSAHQQVQDALDADPALGSHWRAINDSPAFLDWLKLADPISGRVRMHLLAEAYNGGEAVRTTALFRAYVAEQTPQAPPAAPPAPHTPPVPTVGTAGTGRPTLEEFAAPGRSAGAAVTPGAQQEKRLWTHASITAFYRDLTRGVYRTKPAEARRLEEDIIAAAQEGRIR